MVKNQNTIALLIVGYLILLSSLSRTREMRHGTEGVLSSSDSFLLATLFKQGSMDCSGVIAKYEKSSLRLIIVGRIGYLINASTDKPWRRFRFKDKFV